VNSIADLSRHQQLRRTPVDTASGSVDLVAPPVVVAGAELKLGAVPSLGQHSDSIRREFE
ncbi:MAG: CoA transferase, partial [Halieaceae bacterium]|nr:CoA transferase [Halieaceae bacterium]